MKLSDWQEEQVQMYLDRIDAADSLDALSVVVSEFAPTRQSWLLNELMPRYTEKVDILREGRPPDTLLVIDQMNWVFADWSSCCDPSKASRMFGSRLRELAAETSARWVVVAGESTTELERKRVFPGYKSSRTKPDDGVLHTASIVSQGCQSIGVPYIQVDGWEADDIAATLTTATSLRGDRSVICTSDRDQNQLLKKGKCSIWNKGEYKTAEALFLEKGLEPSQYVDYLCIIGKDDVPGWSGIGDKTARSLLSKYGTFMGICDYDHQFTETKRKSLKEFQDFFFTAKQVHTLNRWLDIEFNWDTMLDISNNAKQGA